MDFEFVLIFDLFFFIKEEYLQKFLFVFEDVGGQINLEVDDKFVKMIFQICFFNGCEMWNFFEFLDLYDVEFCFIFIVRNQKFNDFEVFNDFVCLLDSVGFIVFMSEEYVLEF